MKKTIGKGTRPIEAPMKPKPTLWKTKRTSESKGKSFKKTKGKKSGPRLAPNGKKFQKHIGCLLGLWKTETQGSGLLSPKDFRSTNHQANITREFDAIMETNMVSNITNWWLDTSATRHIYGDKSLFTNFQILNNEERLYMRNSTNFKIKGKEKVVLNLTSIKKLTLQDVLYVLNIRNNLVSSPKLVSKSFNITFESNAFVLTKRGIFARGG